MNDSTAVSRRIAAALVLLAAAATLTEANAQVRWAVEAAGGQPFGVGHVVMLAPGSELPSPLGLGAVRLSEKNGRASIFVRQLDPLTKEPVGAEREVFASTGNRLNLNFPKGNGMIGVAADRIVFEATAMTGNIYLARPKQR